MSGSEPTASKRSFTVSLEERTRYIVTVEAANIEDAMAAARAQWADDLCPYETFYGQSQGVQVVGVFPENRSEKLGD